MKRPEAERHHSQSTVFETNAQNTELVCLRLGKMQGTYDPLCSWYKCQFRLRLCISRFVPNSKLVKVAGMPLSPYAFYIYEIYIWIILNVNLKC